MSSDTVYMMVALRRMKDNPGMKEICIREIADPTEDAMNEATRRLVKRMSDDPGLWRIYRSVNQRDLHKAKKKLMIEMIADDSLLSIGSKWKSVMMEPACKVGRGLFLIDVDHNEHTNAAAKRYIDDDTNLGWLPDGITPTIYHCVLDFLEFNGVKIEQITRTINGCHFVCQPFDTRDLLNRFKGTVEVKKDALLFLKAWIVKESE